VNEIYKIELDIDRNRIRSILREAYRVCGDTLGLEFNITVDEFVSKINPHLESNRVTVPVLLSLPSYSYPDMGIEVNIRKKKLIARMENRKKRILLNRYLTKL
jgi:hypothetical protein